MRRLVIAAAILAALSACTVRPPPGQFGQSPTVAPPPRVEAVPPPPATTMAWVPGPGGTWSWVPGHWRG